MFTLVLLTFILFCRKPDAFLNPQFWAEDGVIFFKQNYDYGLNSFVIPHSGYLLIVPRIIALIASWFPVSMAPAIYNYSALGLMLLTAGMLFSSRCFIPLKPLIALSIVFVPHFGEVFMTITNAQWYLCFLPLILLCMEPPTKLYQFIFDYLIIITCSLTGPFIVFTFPLFLLRYLLKRTRYNFGILLVTFICILIQGWFIINTFESEKNVFSLNIDAWINILGIRLFGRLFLIESIYEVIPPIILAIMAVIIPIVLIFFASSKRQKYLIITFLFFGMSLIASTFYKFKGFPELIAYDVNNGDRYFYPYYIIIMWILVIGLTSPKAYKRQVSTLLILLIVVASAQYFRAPKYINYHWKQYSDEIKSGFHVRVPINPPGWGIELGYKQKGKIDPEQVEIEE